MDRAGPYGFTALMDACFFGREESAIALCDAGADLSLVNSFGRTAAELAQNRSHFGCARALARPRAPLPWSRERHDDSTKPRREQAAALVRAGAILSLATANRVAFRDAWNEYMKEAYLPEEVKPLSRVV